MKKEYQKVKMIVEFDVPVDRKSYGERNTNTFDWRKYAEHDMREYLKDFDEWKGDYSCINSYEEVYFEYGKKFKKEIEDLDFMR